MVRWACGWVLAFCFFATGVAMAAEKVPQYVGVDGCKSCHKKELIGDQYGEWLKGKHAEAFKTLQSDDAREVAAKKGLTVPPHESPDCLKCHSTSYGLQASQIKKKPLSHEDGVQCESCHGPGSLYKKKKTMSDYKKSVAAGMWEPSKDAKICTTCHNSESPTWDGFDFEDQKDEIEHPIPKDVKGKYLQIVKERKARGEAVDDGEDEEE